MSDLKQSDHYLTDDGPAALVVREHLVPVEGADGVLFPPTYAPAEDAKKFAGGYNIDVSSKNVWTINSTTASGAVSSVKMSRTSEKNICLIDSVGAQANRIEPIFAKEKYAALIPQIVVEAGEKKVNILDASHRAGDALVRCSALKAQLQEAFKQVLKGDATLLAKVAPTSLVFGVWDSRDTQAKLPRVIASSVRAFDVTVLRRSAQFNPSAEYVTDKLLDEPTDTATKKAYAERGFVTSPPPARPAG